MRHTGNKTFDREDCGCSDCHFDRGDCSCLNCHYKFMRRHVRARRIVAVLLVFAGLMIIVGIAKVAS